VVVGGAVVVVVVVGVELLLQAASPSPMINPMRTATAPLGSKLVGTSRVYGQRPGLCLFLMPVGEHFIRLVGPKIASTISFR